MSRFTTLVTILFAFASAALAVDGTVLINQSTITNGLANCPTGGHLPIVICQPGSYRLSGNITVPDANTDAIHITADNVTLDLNGFAILGPATCTFKNLNLGVIFPLQCSPAGTGVGILSFNNNIGLSNGAVNGMGSAGIQIFGNGTRIESLRVANNAGTGLNGGGIIGGSALINNCTVTMNAQIGIFVTDGTVNLSSIVVNGGVGIQGLVSVVASNNSVYQNGQDGIANVTLAVNNTIVQNAGFGFSCVSGFTCGFEGNVFNQLNGRVVSGGTSLGHNSSNGVVF